MCSGTSWRWLCVILTVAGLLLFSHPATIQAMDDGQIWDAAVATMDSGDTSQAAKLFSQLLQQFPSSPKAPGAQLKLAEIKRKTDPDATKELIQAYSLVTNSYPSSPEAAEALVATGFLYSKTRSPADTQNAIRMFTTFLQSYPGHALTAKVLQSLGLLYARNRDYAKAEAALDGVRTSAGVTNELAETSALHSAFIKIMKYYASKDKAQLSIAIDAFSKLTQSGYVGVRAKADLGIAEAMVLLRKPLEAREKYKQIASAYAAEPYYLGLALYGAAFCSEDAGRLSEAVEDWAALLASQSGWTLAEKNATWKSACLATTNSNTRAMVVVSGQYDLIPGSDILNQGAFSRAKCMHGLGRYDEAIAMLTELMDFLPDGTPLDTRAAQLLERCRNAKGQG